MKAASLQCFSPFSLLFGCHGCPALSNVAVYAQAQAQESKLEAGQTAQIQPGTSRTTVPIILFTQYENVGRLIFGTNDTVDRIVSKTEPEALMVNVRSLAPA